MDSSRKGSHGHELTDLINPVGTSSLCMGRTYQGLIDGKGAIGDSSVEVPHHSTDSATKGSSVEVPHRSTDSAAVWRSPTIVLTPQQSGGPPP
jgi:hypothetical protein